MGNGRDGKALYCGAGDVIDTKTEMHTTQQKLQEAARLCINIYL
jgi:hypothetical protein